MTTHLAEFEVNITEVALDVLGDLVSTHLLKHERILPESERMTPIIRKVISLGSCFEMKLCYQIGTQYSHLDRRFFNFNFDLEREILDFHMGLLLQNLIGVPARPPRFGRFSRQAFRTARYNEFERKELYLWLNIDFNKVLDFFVDVIK
jgi:hypothetical protein